MKRPLIIVNPSSASNATRDAWPALASELAAHLGAFEPRFTENPGDATRIAAEASEKGRLIVACGGDGTISEVASGILISGTEAILGILPSGTGGDFRKTLEISARPSDAARVLRDGQTRLIDVGRVTYANESGAHESRYFVGVASFGMSAEVIGRVKAGGPEWLPTKGPKWLTGRAKFGLSMAETALKTAAARVIVQLDDHPEQRLSVANFCIANARYFGGGMKIAPDAKLADGKFDVVVIGDLGAIRIITNAPRLYSGTHLNIDKVAHSLAKKVIARPANKDELIGIELDGELPGYLPATFQVLPRALRVRCPMM